jgi:hypothetical protein
MTKRSSTWDNALSGSRHLITAQGEIGYAYNRLQEMFFHVFNLAMALERPDRGVTYYNYALELWHVIQNDTPQRDLALASLEHLPTALKIKGGVERLRWAKKKTDDLALYRNLIIHTPVSLRYPYPLPEDGKLPEPIPAMGGASTRPINRRRLRLIKSPKFWKGLRNDFLNLSDYVDFVTRHIAWLDYERKNGPVPGARRSWPRKPRLPSVRQKDLIERSATTPTSPPKRRKRRKPSAKLPHA